MKKYKIFAEDKKFYLGNINCSEDGRFSSVHLEEELREEEVFQRKEDFLIPGLIDIHFHGCLGQDFCDGTRDAIECLAKYEIEHGVTGICPATLTLALDDLDAVLSLARDYAEEGEKEGKARLLGINMEGPFISHVKKGAQNEKYILQCDEKILSRFIESSGGLVKFVGLAPEENPDFEEFIKKAKGRVKISLAHTNADFETALLAYRAGASHAVHLFNAMTGLDHRNPGVVGATVESKEVYAELITDGIHVHPVMVRAAFALLGEDRVVLISDSLRSTGMPDGIYDLGGQKVKKEGKRCTLVEGGNLAGSVSNVFDCMKTAVQLMRIPFKKAILASTINPAKSLGVEKELGSISVGKRADYLILDNDLNLKAVYQSGKEIERK
ncbi:N-acetylglucosamine-6-phosphate deacetylase [Oribacterium parvum ACB1]|jgi:N-acetylglucosamine-6-phosphate deacetylase|uniref:N-acetylglucosamine-6-phosphate deacetylase n=1 Tax=Oribacterium parvum ACB1 TaxID=796943 RepID=G9WQQ8_9FIRM|nr:N-acetylglucosamine-6-phosphate deacetylase [Oribacterium parvum]EHL09718.1 N-acetylglucosamine-6-phosphate deacetylase [Oribacterium parvum ACB1]EJF12913.1 N-acetylglucosamine-6-phosphate deacetylase [Oribacterium parvum ACB8]